MTEVITGYDIVVIGGGINGAGIARDAALRGLRVLLLEKNDFGSGTSSWSSRLIHGGLRYLEFGEIPLVFESLHERRRLRLVAAHLVTKLRLNLPIYKNARRGKLIIRLGMFAYDLLSFGKKVPRHRMLSKDELLQEEPGLNAEGLLGGAQYYDAQVSFAERLVLENIIGAKEAGADVRNYSPVIGISVRQGTVRGLQFIDRASGTEVEVSAGLVINAAGPWVDRVLATVNREMPRFMGGTKGSHIIVGHFDGAPRSAFYVEARVDSRPFFIIPWNDQYLIGTTDIRYEKSLDHIRASRAEVDYLLAETNRVFPNAGLGTDDINFAYAGVRPLPYRDKGPESAITRRHIIKVNRKIAKGLISIIGGKLTTYRNLAEHAVDRLGKILRRKLPECRTRDTLLPGAWGMERAREVLLASAILTEYGANRLLSIYGGRAVAITELAIAESPLQQTLDSDSHYLAAEIAFVIREEFATTLVDVVFRRTMIGLNADQGRSLYDAIASLAATEFGWSRQKLQEELRELIKYAESLRIAH